MASSNRSYADALSLLGGLQSNSAVVSMVQMPGTDMNQLAIPEMLDWVGKAGYKVEDFNALKVVHVAGTKGKGSVCAMLSSVLQQYSEAQSGVPNSQIHRGLGKIGLYTSPHLVSVRERIRINGEPISQDLFTRYFYDLWDRFSSVAASAGHPEPESPQTKPNFFRFLTIMAFHVFLKEGVTSAVVECGIGGEYDSTNILTRDAITAVVITKLGIDHELMLGNTIDSIAWHKAGIMKKGARCFTVWQVDGAREVLEKRAAEKDVSLSVVKRHQQLANGEVKLSLMGDFQKDNASLAIAAAATHLERFGYENLFEDGKLPLKFVQGLEQARWAGRCEVIKEGNISWWVDGAHTIDSIEEAAKWFAAEGTRFPPAQTMLIFNQQSRDAPALLKALSQSVRSLTGGPHIFGHAAFCTNTSFRTEHSSHDAVNLQVQREARKAWIDLGYRAEGGFESSTFETIEDAIERARSLAATQTQFRVFVTGSLYLVGNFLRVLQGNSALS